MEKIAINLILTAVVVYLLFSFVAASLDITAWASSQREAAAFLFFGIGICVILFNILQDELLPNKKK